VVDPTPTRGQGRPTRYCSPACRPSSQKQHSATRRLTVEIDHEPTENGVRPAGRVWFVQLSAGSKHVIMATGLGRPSARPPRRSAQRLTRPPVRPTTSPISSTPYSAGRPPDHLADQLNALLGRAKRAQPGEVE